MPAQPPRPAARSRRCRPAPSRYRPCSAGCGGQEWCPLTPVSWPGSRRPWNAFSRRPADPRAAGKRPDHGHGPLLAPGHAGQPAPSCCCARAHATFMMATSADSPDDAADSDTPPGRWGSGGRSALRGSPLPKPGAEDKREQVPVAGTCSSPAGSHSAGQAGAGPPSGHRSPSSARPRAGRPIHAGGPRRGAGLSPQGAGSPPRPSAPRPRLPPPEHATGRPSRNSATAGR
jgi:hypothetical protein